MTAAPLLDQQEMMPQTPFDMASDTVRAGMLDLFRGVMKEDRSARRSEVRTAWKQRAFRNGIQHLYYDPSSYAFYTPAASGKKLPEFMGVFNIYTPHYRSFVSILSATPGINFVPKDLQQSNDVTAAAYAEKMRARVDQIVDMRDRQGEVAGYFCTDGRTITWSRTDKDGNLRCTIHGVLESKVPIYSRKIERWSYCVLSEEFDIHEARDAWGEYADEIEPDASGTADATYERLARLDIISNKKHGIGESLKSLTTEHTCWLRKSRYRKAKEETRAYLQQQFPNGVRMTIVGDVLVEAIPEPLGGADVGGKLAVAWPSPGQGQNRPSMLHDLLPVQEDFNDYKNELREQAKYLNSATWVHGAAVDPDAIPEQSGEAGAVHVINPPNGLTVDQCVTKESAGQLSPDLINACESLLQFGEFTTGDLPSLQGSGTPDQETASGQKLLQDQAKGQLSTAWGAYQRLFANTYAILVREEAMLEGQGDVAVQSGGLHDSFNPAAILEGNFGCYPDTDSAFPETTADKRASLQMVLTQVGQADPSIPLHPDNLKLVKQYSGLKDLIIPGAEARDKQLREIEQLLNEPPIPDQSQMVQYEQGAQQMMAQGQQPPLPPMTCSVPIDVDWDFHKAEMDKVQEWLNSDACSEQQRKGNVLGIQNVKLHGAAHRQALQAQTPPPHIEPPKVSMTMAVTDPSTIAQFAQAAGATATTPDGIATSQVMDDRKTAAETQHVAAQAQHQSVLAAKEAVSPAKVTQIQIPDQTAPEEK